MFGEESKERVVDESAACMESEVANARLEEKEAVGEKPESTTNNDQVKLASEVSEKSSTDADAGSRASRRAAAVQVCPPGLSAPSPGPQQIVPQETAMDCRIESIAGGPGKPTGGSKASGHGPASADST